MEGVALGPEELVSDRPFTDPAHTVREGQVMQKMLRTEAVRVQEWAGGKGVQEDGIVLRERYETGRRCLLVVPDVTALLESPDLTAVGFFGAAREDVDHTVLFSLEDELVDDMVASVGKGLLSYFDLELDVRGTYGNLVLFATPEASEAWSGNPIHRRAVELSPGHYTTVRLHRGSVPGGLLGAGDLGISRTRYLDFTGAAHWRALRTLAAPV